MKFIKFNDKKIDSFLFMELTDLARTLAKSDQVEVEYGVQSYYNPFEKKIYLSHFWKDRSYHDMVAGLKSDVYLRAIGTTYSSMKEFANLLDNIKDFKCKSFAKQIFMLFEDIRIEEYIKQERPGTKRVFFSRQKIYRKFFMTQLTLNKERSIFTDALFCAMYLKLTAKSPLEDIPEIHLSIDPLKRFIEHQLSRVFDARTTEDIVWIVNTLMESFEEVLEKDMLNTYFFFPELAYEQVDETSLFKDLKAKPKLSEELNLDKEKSGDEEVLDEEMPTWHRETEAPAKSFLQFDLEHGAKTDLSGGALREGEDGDQALGAVQGRAQQSNRKDYRKLESLETVQDLPPSGGQSGKENRYAFPIFKAPEKPSIDEISEYRHQAKTIESYQKRLKQMIQKTLEHKKILPRTDLHSGRLNHKLLRYFTERNPRLFFKKHDPSTEIDAVFTLLVDCSASMFDKMAETKRGIILFHEALKSVAVPHQIVGFWEDTNDATNISQPNYFHTVVSFIDSLTKDAGPHIMQLEPKEDNRDGFALRQMTNMLMKRNESQKFLIVFSDGEPAAFDYEQNGIVDTHEAVIAARKRKIEVINVFLSNSEIEESQIKTIQDMYGKYCLFVPDVDQLPDRLFPLLKKLLNKSLL
ncbi:nitric oxide reductase activation protein NorD [Bacillus changyiensis]|uniref:nitric oxide reductase activation protein NorD n=1 Tax=Bacillus changyiensis TaxID=3004103 RepID=UPI0022E7B348|nr:VWA domain-containing protein [Bacillus changyiensis]MDA1475049.1 VWA domain-containing protein [Bacillus changyiensis]